MRVKQIKIPFYVTPEIERFVYVYLVDAEKALIMIDSGVAGSERMIEEMITEMGRKPGDLEAILLTHAHPDHIGTANYFRETYGAEVYASEGERPWIEDIDLQFEQRPIPNFYHLAGKSTPVDHVVKDRDCIRISDSIQIEVIGTPGHSFDDLSYRVGDCVFLGDAVPVRGDIPIFIDSANTGHTLQKIEALSDVQVFYPAWDRAYSFEMMKEKIADARKVIDELESYVNEAEYRTELSELVSYVCEKLQMPAWRQNLLFARTVASCRRRLTNQMISRIAMEQSAADLNAKATDFLQETNVIVKSEVGPKARKYYREPIACNLVSYGNNIVASVRDEYRGIVEQYIGKFSWYHCFETPNMHWLDDRMSEFGQRVCFMAEYFLPDLSKLTRLSCEYELRVLESKDFRELYLPEWSNALCEARKELDVLGVGAYDNGRLIGLAGCSADCETMWQIGVDVLPEYRRRGIAAALTSNLAVEILDRGKVPFYCCAWSNLRSSGNAIKSGFLPAWVEMTVKPAELVDEMNA